MIDFPSSPTVGQIVTSPNGTQWKWDGTAWQIMRAVGVQTPDTRGYTFFQEAQPTATRMGDTWIQNSTGYTYAWNGSVWFRSPAAPYVLPDVRARFTAGANGYPGTNGGVPLHTTVWNTNPSYIQPSGPNWYLYATGLWFFQYELLWASQGFPYPQAAWIQDNGGNRYCQEQYSSTGQPMTMGSGIVARVPTSGSYFSVNVYSEVPSKPATCFSSLVVDIVYLGP